MKDYNQVMRAEMSTIAIGRLIENPVLSVIFLIFGVIAILIAMFGKEFTVADSEGHEFKSKRPMPTWVGKLIAGIVGSAFVLYALTSLWSQAFR